MAEKYRHENEAPFLGAHRRFSVRTPCIQRLLQLQPKNERPAHSRTYQIL